MTLQLWLYHVIHIYTIHAIAVPFLFYTFICSITWYASSWFESIVYYWYMAKGKLRPAHRNSLEHQINCVDMRKLDGSGFFLIFFYSSDSSLNRYKHNNPNHFMSNKIYDNDVVHQLVYTILNEIYMGERWSGVKFKTISTNSL